MQSTVLILGARGRFGLACARAFADAGWRVLAHMRPHAQVPAEVQGDARIQWLQIDLTDKDALARAGAGAALVVHALNPAYTNRAWRSEALPMLESTVAIARTLGATVMFPGNIYNFGSDMPAVLREDTPQRASTVKGQIRIGMEEHLRRSGVRSIVVRAGDFFGSGTGTWFDQTVAKDLHKGVLTYPGARDVPTAWAYLPDLARAFVALAGKRAEVAAFEVFHFAGHTVTGQRWVDVMTPLAQQQGWVRSGPQLRFAGLPWPLISLMGWFIPTWGALAEMRYLWNRPQRLANDKLERFIGAEPSTPFAEAARQALVDLGKIAAPRAHANGAPAVA